MNYKIILDEDELSRFVNWLPELKEGECYYLTLLARKKYHASARNDKSQCKRVIAISKDWLIKKIRQLELPDGTYTNKDGSPMHADSLALYISVNPRSFALAQRLLLKKLADTVADNRCNMNPASMAMSAIQKAKSRTVYVDFDYDGADFEEWKEHFFDDILNPEAYSVLKTRGGFHLLVDPAKVVHTRLWHGKLSAVPECDVVGDNLTPVAGCTQGGFIPRLIK